MTTAHTQQTLADFNVINLTGKPVALKDYLGKVVLIVNTASACSFTPQYKALQALYGDLQAKGLEILAFPCNQFGAQETGNAEQIGAFCNLRFSVTFPLMAKIDVNGPNADPLYQWLKTSKPGVLGTQGIKWNFTKFLIAKDGTVFKRYGSIVKPQSIKADIDRLLAA
jgi:glutathione peroxidase